MPSIVCNVAAIGVAALFYAWRTHYCRHQQLRERVAYLLWVVANQGC